jgi:chemotaxis protein CheC
MSAQPHLNADQRDALQEIVNVGVGAAGAGLAKVLDSFVELAVPGIQQVPSRDIGATIAVGVWANRRVNAVRQAFYNRMEGEVIILFETAGCKELADLLGHEGDIGSAVEQELLLDVSNILAGACLNGIAKQLDVQLGYSPPLILCEDRPIEKVFEEHPPACEEALLIQIDFKLEARSFTCQLLIFMPGESLAVLQVSLDKFIESL